MSVLYKIISHVRIIQGFRTSPVMQANSFVMSVLYKLICNDRITRVNLSLPVRTRSRGILRVHNVR